MDKIYIFRTRGGLEVQGTGEMVAKQFENLKKGNMIKRFTENVNNQTITIDTDFETIADIEKNIFY